MTTKIFFFFFKHECHLSWTSLLTCFLLLLLWNSVWSLSSFSRCSTIHLWVQNDKTATLVSTTNKHICTLACYLVLATNGETINEFPIKMLLSVRLIKMTFSLNISIYWALIICFNTSIIAAGQRCRRVGQKTVSTIFPSKLSTIRSVLLLP